MSSVSNITFTCDVCAMKETHRWDKAKKLPPNWGTLKIEVESSGRFLEVLDVCPECKDAVINFIDERKGV